MYLVDDEDVAFPCGGGAVTVRIRIWRAKGRPAVVLASLRGGASHWGVSLSARIADRAYGTMLGFPRSGMHYFEAEDGRVYLVTFRCSGSTIRVRHQAPSRKRVSPFSLEDLVGAEVEP